MQFYRLCLLVVLIGFSGCNRTATPKPAAGGSTKSTVLISVTSDATKDTQAVDMAMKLAGFSLAEGRNVALFFNVKGVTVPTKAFAADLKYKDNDPIKSQLQQVIKDGAEVHVCPICMKALEVKSEDIMQGAFVTTRAKLFANIGADTAVFTY